ncbi:hypothetical protein M3197_08495 [Sporosarcina aquimarina]|uniref:hypothetical protein n=1 Tax=Sporosarcina aquimarina TaxID=114975 RepID=UPI0020402987|nr:hypothetical protein [Sporosarcina aquimarina]MCM3757527.1 hypothetical protein [Sporosarcina aquimarina]
MKQSPFERPTNHYDEQLYLIDEQICALLKQRKDHSKDNLGFPSEDAISQWATKYGLYEDYLSSFFGTLRMEEFFRPRVEPTGFRKHIPVLKSVEIDERLYSITFIRQYENASVINLNVDWDGINDSPHMHEQGDFELYFGEQYDCRQNGGSGSTGYFKYDYIVSPPLPDDFSGLELVVKEYSDHFMEKPTGIEFVIHL